jgi:hypothetical protein
VSLLQSPSAVPTAVPTLVYVNDFIDEATGYCPSFDIAADDSDRFSVCAFWGCPNSFINAKLCHENSTAFGDTYLLLYDSVDDASLSADYEAAALTLDDDSCIEQAEFFC